MEGEGKGSVGEGKGGEGLPPPPNWGVWIRQCAKSHVHGLEAHAYGMMYGDR